MSFEGQNTPQWRTTDLRAMFGINEKMMEIELWRLLIVHSWQKMSLKRTMKKRRQRRKIRRAVSKKSRNRGWWGQRHTMQTWRGRWRLWSAHLIERARDGSDPLGFVRNTESQVPAQTSWIRSPGDSCTLKLTNRQVFSLIEKKKTLCNFIYNPFATRDCFKYTYCL